MKNGGDGLSFSRPTRYDAEDGRPYAFVFPLFPCFLFVIYAEIRHDREKDLQLFPKISEPILHFRRIRAVIFPEYYPISFKFSEACRKHLLGYSLQRFPELVESPCAA